MRPISIRYTFPCGLVKLFPSQRRRPCAIHVVTAVVVMATFQQSWKPVSSNRLTSQNFLQITFDRVSRHMRGCLLRFIKYLTRRSQKGIRNYETEKISHNEDLWPGLCCQFVKPSIVSYGRVNNLAASFKERII